MARLCVLQREPWCPQQAPERVENACVGFLSTRNSGDPRSSSQGSVWGWLPAPPRELLELCWDYPGWMVTIGERLSGSP